MASPCEPEQVPDCRAILGEGAIWNRALERLHWIDIEGRRVFTYDPATDTARDGFEGRGPVVMAVDNLPAEISLESSVFFSQALKPFLPALSRADFGSGFESLELPPPIKKAMILHRGRLTPGYLYLQKFLDSTPDKEVSH